MTEPTGPTDGTAGPGAGSGPEAALGKPVPGFRPSSLTADPAGPVPGSWPSPVTATRAAAAGRSLEAVAFAGREVWWSEGRPSEGGRVVVVRRSTSGEVEDITPPGANARTRVHEYGGRSWLPIPGPGPAALVFVEFTDQRLYLVDPIGSAPVPLTEAPDRPAGLRYADLFLDAPRRRVLAVRELHQGDGTFGTVRRTVVAVPLDGSGPVVALLAGHSAAAASDFFAAPRISPAGDALVWVAWNHPDMPWDSTRVRLVRLDRSGQPTGPVTTVAGGNGVSVVDPRFLSDGSVLVISDESGWWQPIVVDPRTGARRRLSELEQEFAEPLWQLGYRSWAALPGGRLLVTPGGVPSVLDTLDESLQPLDERWTACGDLDTTPDGRVAMIVAGPSLSGEVVFVEPGRPPQLLRAADDEPLPAEFVPTPRHRQIDGIHVDVYPPTHPSCAAEPGTAPLLMMVHGGPTAAAFHGLSAQRIFFTSRGFAVAMLDYRGSTGYGRPYRDALKGRWAELDVADAITVARGLLADGTAGAAVIDGGSAGGLTVLGALTTRDHPFSGGTSLFGVADLAALARDTHDFESRYLDSIVGPDHATWTARSPISRAAELSTPVLLLQGGKDPVVTPDQAEAFAAACAARGVPHALVIFPDESHGFRAAAARTAALEAELSFYGQILGFPTPDVPLLRLSTG